MAPRLLSVDPSLTCSGWALFSLDGSLLGVGKIKCLPATEALGTRLLDLQKKIHQTLRAIELGARDVLVCEGPTTMKDPKAAIKVEQVRSIFEAVAREFEVRVPGRINPRTVHSEVMGLRGRQLPRLQVKEIAVRLAETLYQEPLKRLGFSPDVKNLSRNQDIVDALLLGNVALSKVNTAVLSGMELERFFDRSSGKLRAGVV